MKLIILQRDGVINQRAEKGVKSLDDWHPLPGSIKAMGKLCQAGYRLVVMVNNPGVSAGNPDLEALHKVHNRLGQLLEQYGGHVDALFYCPHDLKEDYDCQNLETGIYSDIKKRFQCDLNNVPVVCDNLIDFDLIESIGASPVLVKTGSGEMALAAADSHLLNTITVYNDLADFAEVIIVETNE